MAIQVFIWALKNGNLKKVHVEQASSKSKDKMANHFTHAKKSL